VPEKQKKKKLMRQLMTALVVLCEMTFETYDSTQQWANDQMNLVRQSGPLEAEQTPWPHQRPDAQQQQDLTTAWTPSKSGPDRYLAVWRHQRFGAQYHDQPTARASSSQASMAKVVRTLGGPTHHRYPN